MKKFVKYFLAALGIVVLIIGGAALFINNSDFPTYETPIQKITVETTPLRIERGRKLAMMLCVECHQNAETKQITGRLMYDLPSEFGTAFTKNITQHPEKGIGTWTDSELIYLLRTGIHPKTHQAVPPYMIKLPAMADEDLYSIVAWLRSSDPLVQARDVDNKTSSPSFLTKFLMRVVLKPFPYPSSPVLLPDSTDKIALGKYLVRNLGCNDCHAADVTKVNPLEIEKTAGFFGGGSNWLDVNKKVIYASNITPDVETGIGSWSEADFRKAMREAIRPDGTIIRYPMERKTQLTDHEISAMYAYLRTVPKLHNPRKPAEEYTLPPNASPGKKVYFKYGCQRCHGETGLGIGDLRYAHKKYQNDSTMIDVIKHPSKYFPETVMVQWAGIIKEEEFIPLVQYVRELGKSVE